jgi:hypothetical protein
MKTTSIVLLLSVIVFSSCEKNDVDESGTANIRVVNASPNSSVQNFYLANNALITTGLGFTEASGYISTHSGNRLVAQFRNKDTNADYATGELWLGNGESYTVYLAGEGQNARVKVFEDKFSTPPGDMARVKFIHLSDGAPSDIRIKNSAGDNLVLNLSRNLASGYVNIPAGTLALEIYGTGQGNNVGNFSLSPFTAGKLYNVYITGASSADIKVYKIEY